MIRSYVVRVFGATALPLVILLAYPAQSMGEATPAVSSGWQVVDQITLHQAAVGPASEVVTLSPDGLNVAGLMVDSEFRQQLCTWSVPGLDAACIPVPDTIDPESLQWSPDSTAIAFSLTGLPDLVDSDIYVYELATRDLSNLTDDDYEGTLPLDESSEPDHLPLDLFPTWSVDSESLAFVRTDVALEQPPTELWVVARTSGAVELRHVVREDLPHAIMSPMIQLENGSLLYTVASAFLMDPGDGLWLLNPSGDSTLLMPGTVDDAFPMPVATDVLVAGDAIRVVGYSALRLAQQDVLRSIAFVLELDTGDGTVAIDLDTGDGTVAIDLDTFAGIVSPAQFAPDGGIIGLEWRDGQAHLLIQHQGEATALTKVPGSPFAVPRGPEWAANNVILIGATLVFVQPAAP